MNLFVAQIHILFNALSIFFYSHILCPIASSEVSHRAFFSLHAYKSRCWSWVPCTMTHIILSHFRFPLLEPMQKRILSVYCCCILHSLQESPKKTMCCNSRLSLFSLFSLLFNFLYSSGLNTSGLYLTEYMWRMLPRNGFQRKGYAMNELYRLEWDVRRCWKGWEHEELLQWWVWRTMARCAWVSCVSFFLACPI